MDHTLSSKMLEERQQIIHIEFMLYIMHCTKLFEYINSMVFTYIRRLVTLRLSEEDLNIQILRTQSESLIQRAWARDRKISIFKKFQGDSDALW